MPLLTTHFSVNELSATSQPYYNVPGPVEELYLLRLAELVLEPLRHLWGCPVAVSSGYRSAAVNAAVGGRPDSAHRFGRAADVEPIGLPIDDAYRMVAQSGIPFDQAVLERNQAGARWIHLAIAPIYQRPRKQCLVTDNGVSFVTYQLPQPPDGGLA